MCKNENGLREPRLGEYSDKVEFTKLGREMILYGVAKNGYLEGDIKIEINDVAGGNVLLSVYIVDRNGKELARTRYWTITMRSALTIISKEKIKLEVILT